MISEEMKSRLDSDVQKILNRCMQEVEQLFTKEKALLDKFAKELLEKEHRDYDQMEEIFKSFGKTRALPGKE
jgi:ATP-dependent Zn protease